MRDLVVLRGEKTVIDGLSFNAAGGEALFVTGPNGAGKTTLLRCLAGLIASSSGTVQFDGGDRDRTLGEQCHATGHANAVKPGLTVKENLSFWAAYLAGSPQETGARDAARRVDHALDRFALSALADIPARYLSAGQKRRAGLARLLVADRPIWLLDEPTASLDAASAGLVASAVDRHVSDGGIAIVATHAPLALAKASELRLGAGEGESSSNGVSHAL